MLQTLENENVECTFPEQTTEMLFLPDLCSFAGSKTSSAGKNQEESSGAARQWKG